MKKKKPLPAAPEPKKTDNTLVPSTLINKFEGTYEPFKERAYYRNEGNKHIPSKGVKC